MGKKRVGKGKHLLFYFAGFGALLIVVSGCIPYEEQRQSAALAKANDYMAAGNFQSALSETEKILKEDPQFPVSMVLFRKGLIYSHPWNPDRDFEKAIENFNQVLNNPASGMLANEAEVIVFLTQKLLDMETVISTLNALIDSMKTNTANQEGTINRLKGQAKKQHADIKKLQTRIQSLEEQIEKLKSIDLRIEKEKRKPLPK